MTIMNKSSRETPEAGGAGKESMEDRGEGGDRYAGAMAYADESGEEANISRVPGGCDTRNFPVFLGSDQKVARIPHLAERVN